MQLKIIYLKKKCKKNQKSCTKKIMTKLNECNSKKIESNKMKKISTDFKLSDNFSQMMMENKIRGFTRSEIELLDDNSSMSSMTSEEQQHVLAPKCMAGKNRPCLTWGMYT